MTNIPYYSNEELVEMKQDIADRKFRVRMIGALVVGALIAAAIATLFFVPGAASTLFSAGPEVGKLVMSGILAVGAGITSLFTMKELKRLEMDEKYLQTYMQGKNYWGEGYRKEVAEHGYSLQSPQFPGIPSRSNNIGRE